MGNGKIYIRRWKWFWFGKELNTQKQPPYFDNDKYPDPRYYVSSKWTDNLKSMVLFSLVKQGIMDMIPFFFSCGQKSLVQHWQIIFNLVAYCASWIIWSMCSCGRRWSSAQCMHKNELQLGCTLVLPREGFFPIPIIDLQISIM